MVDSYSDLTALLNSKHMPTILLTSEMLARLGLIAQPYMALTPFMIDLANHV